MRPWWSRRPRRTDAAVAAPPARPPPPRPPSIPTPSGKPRHRAKGRNQAPSEFAVEARAWDAFMMVETNADVYERRINNWLTIVRGKSLLLERAGADGAERGEGTYPRPPSKRRRCGART